MTELRDGYYWVTFENDKTRVTVGHFYENEVYDEAWSVMECNDSFNMRQIIPLRRIPDYDGVPDDELS